VRAGGPALAGTLELAPMVPTGGPHTGFVPVPSEVAQALYKLVDNITA